MSNLKMLKQYIRIDTNEDDVLLKQLSEISHKFVIRSNAVKQLSNDMYIVFDGKRYDIKYFQPNYKYHSSIE